MNCNVDTVSFLVGRDDDGSIWVTIRRRVFKNVVEYPGQLCGVAPHGQVFISAKPGGEDWITFVLELYQHVVEANGFFLWLDLLEIGAVDKARISPEI